MKGRTVRKILVVANCHKEMVKEKCPAIVRSIEELGIQCEVFETYTGEENFTVDDTTDMVLSLGGDGTVLFCARNLRDMGVPILPVNFGTFGYISDVTDDELIDVLKLWMEGKNEVSRRMMLRVSVIRNNMEVFTGNALNEAAITSNGISKVVKLNIFLDARFMGQFKADGMLISTPTGSTGYSLAAGGPILDMDIEAMLVTPICPFTLSNRPLVISSDTTITVDVPRGQRTELSLTLDGQLYFDLKENDMIMVKKSLNKTLLIYSDKRNHMEIVRDKLKWAGGVSHA